MHNTQVHTCKKNCRICLEAKPGGGRIQGTLPLGDHIFLFAQTAPIFMEVQCHQSQWVDPKRTISSVGSTASTDTADVSVSMSVSDFLSEGDPVLPGRPTGK